MRLRAPGYHADTMTNVSPAARPDRQYYLSLAHAGCRMPIGTDLVLHDHADAGEIVLDGRRLGQVSEEAACRYGTPLAVPLMDLRLEKADLLDKFGVPEAHIDAFHFDVAHSDDDLVRMAESTDAAFPARCQAHFDSIQYISEETKLVPIGMAIGPFSLMTKLMADPIVPIAMAGMGVSAAEDPGVLMAERCLALAELTVHRSLRAQARAGAQAIILCEPAANVVYLSPKQIEKGSDIFERFVMQPALRVRKLLDSMGVDLIFHDCGALNAFMVRQFGERVHPAMLSLGSSRRLWEDAELVPKDVVLFGNLPTKNFYSDTVVPVERVRELTLELVENMRMAAHPHIVGSECDVLHVPESAATIRRKLDVMLSCGR
jgi:uroporphyrinogen-III decarboxylase